MYMDSFSSGIFSDFDSSTSFLKEDPLLFPTAETIKSPLSNAPLTIILPPHR